MDLLRREEYECSLIFLDDIKITGSHEKLINKMISEYALPNDTYFLYYAVLAGMIIIGSCI